MGTTRITVTQNGPNTVFRAEADILSTASNGHWIRLYARANNGPSGTTGSYHNGLGTQTVRVDGKTPIVNHTANPFLPSGYAQNALRWHDGPVDVFVAHTGATTITIRMGLDYGSVNGSWTYSMSLPAIATVPPAPSPLGLDQITTTTMRYRFQSNGTGGSAIIRWEYQYSTSSNFSSGNGPVTTSSGTSTVTGLTPGNKYYFRSRGVNAIGNGAWSSIISATTLPSGAPGINVNPSASGYNATVTLTPPGGVTGVTLYNIERRRKGTTSPVTAYTSTTTTKSITGLTPGYTYQWRANAEIGTYTSPWTSWTAEEVTQPNPNTSPGDYFDGSTTDTSEVTYAWTGTTNNSTSTASGGIPTGWYTFSNGVGSTGADGAVVQVIDNAPPSTSTYAARVIFTRGATTDGFRAGAHSADVEPLQLYVGSIWVKSSKVQRVVGRLEYYDAGDSLVIGYDSEETVLEANTWTRLVMSEQSPPNADTASFVVVDVDGDDHEDWVAGDTLTMDAAMLTLASLTDYFDGSTPDTIDFTYAWSGTANASTSTRTLTPQSTVDPLADPDCPPLPTPPTPPIVPSDCIEEAGIWRRYTLQINSADVGLWASTVPTLTLQTGGVAERQVRIRYYPNPNNVLPEQLDMDFWDAELILTYIPKDTVLTLDGVTQRAWASVDGDPAIPANQLLYGTNGQPATWPELRCGIGYVITLDVPLDAPAGNLESSVFLTPRM